MDKILSFVIPSYNCEKFLKTAVTSMICKEVLDKLEIIIVNDGSTDSTEEIALSLQNSYPETIEVITQENKGHGGALNTGISAAGGKFVKVIDADDWVTTENLSAFVEKLEKLDADVVLTHHYTIDITTKEIKKWMSYPEQFEKAYNFKQIMNDWKSFDRSLTFHGITYNTEFYKENCIQLSEHVFYEDHEYATIPCCFAKRIVPVDLFIYNYRIGDVAQSVSDVNQLGRSHHTKAVIERLMSEYQTLKLPEKCRGRRYYAMKTQGLMLSYITTVLLVEKDKQRGRAMAEEIMSLAKYKLPLAYSLARKQYKVFLTMNYLHISKKTCTKILNSKLYNKLRGNHDFN